ncbi:DUF3291 domain-containing protein [Methylobacterium sp. SyP6R]|uniref:DUF3291 domain-containing protein n=1 Tax=Methylobacterium sp. SyP6R TaxID=2718876 RepID=UPI001F285A1B|nr:DUF3291 domain-containing protein [Methylobacterium sp. SyP6R]MCF4130067.1 DUF3291 domain-containing protein [Methylobacterium sp. SyP6R]
MSRLAFTTFAIMLKPYGSEVVRGFEAITPAVFRHAEKAPGFITRARELDEDNEALTNFERDWGPWGPFAVPRFYDGGRQTKTDTRASTLSLWTDIEAVRAFAYGGLHARALAQREKWFRKPVWPTYAMWWVGDEYIPTWVEAARNLEFLHDNGPSPRVFDFAQPFDPDGHRLSQIDGQRIEPLSATAS